MTTGRTNPRTRSAPRGASVPPTWRKHPSAALLVAQLAAVLAYPFFGNQDLGRALIGVAGMVIVLAAVAAVRSTPVLTWVAVVFGGPALVLTVLEIIWPADGIVLASAAFHAPFYFYVSYAMLRYLFHDDRVTLDELFCTGAAFTVVAWGFAYLFQACQVLWPGSFLGIDGAGDRTWFELLFVSFTNLCQVGFSDISAVAGHARSLIMVEQVVGVFYVAMVVSRLVSLTVASKTSRRD